MFYEEDERLAAQVAWCLKTHSEAAVIFWALYGCSGTLLADVCVRYSDQTKRTTVMVSQKALADLQN